jgi:hypothetical protein
MVNRNLIFIIFGFLFLVSGILIFAIPQSKTIYSYPAGYYCVPQRGIGYFETNQVPSGAVLIKANPDVTQGQYTNSLDVNFFKMMGCVK